jgi:hypothetical protein
MRHRIVKTYDDAHMGVCMSHSNNVGKEQGFYVSSDT